VTINGTGIAPLVSIAPVSPFNFPNQLKGTTSTAQTFTVSNTGTDVLNISSIVLAGTNASDFVFANTGGTSCSPLTKVVAVGANCTFTVAFAPATTGAKTATVTVTDDNNAVANSIQVTTVNGTGVAPLISIAPVTNPFPFGNQNTGTTSTAQTFTLTNSGTATLNIASIVLAGVDPSQFTLTNAGAGSCSPLPKAVAAGANCTFTMAFAPTNVAPAAKTANVTITDDDNNVANSTQVIGFSGTATQPGFSISSAVVPDFGSVQVGMTQAATGAGIITVSNPGTGPVTLSIAKAGTNPNDFSFVTTCGAVLASGGNCTITASMAPQAGAVGARTATIQVTHNAAAPPAPTSPASVALSGTAVDFALITTATPGAVTAGGSAAYTFNFDTSGGNSLLPTTFACTAGLPRKAACVFNPATIPAGSPDTTVTLTITTTSNTVTVSTAGAAVPMLPTGGGLPPGAGPTITMGVLGLLSIAVVRRRSLRLSTARLCLLALVLLAGGYLAGCAGGSEGGFPEGASGTPPGSYQVTVTATSGSVNRSTNITLNVQ
jgi:hypothetical protein